MTRFLVIIIITTVSCTQVKNQADLRLPIKLIPTASIHGGEPNLHCSNQGELYLSWIEYSNDTTDVLLFSTLENKHWSSPKEIASGSNWFVNWADFPSMVSYQSSSDQLAAHWLQKSGDGTYDYDVRVSQSKNKGQNWEPSFILHKDNINAEHGFVNMMALNNNKIFATWLDGRNTIAHDSEIEEHSHNKAMTLRTAEFDIDGNITAEAELDNKVCDCCQTDAALTDQGPIVVYRDRSNNEIRDISFVRKVKGIWTKPKSISMDNWKIAGCPVNGPAIAAEGENVAVAWYTMAEGLPKVKLVFSNNSGESFSEPFQIDEGNPIGRVDLLLLKNDEALVCWIEQKEDKAFIKISHANNSTKKNYNYTLKEINAARQSGFPRIVQHGNEFIVSWTEAGSTTSVKTLSFNLNLNKSTNG